MKAVLVLVSMLLASSFASAQIAPPDQQQPQQGEQGWVQIASPTTVTINKFASQPNGTLWFGNPDGLFRSSDLGETWFRKEGIEHAAPDFFDDSDGVACTANGGVLITTDGGETWQPSNPHEINSGAPTAVHPDLVFVVSGHNVSKSKDRGRTWFNRQLDASSLYTGTFADSLIGYVTGFQQTGTPIGTLFRTTNGGELWEKIDAPGYDFMDIFALSRDTVFLVASQNRIFRSLDRGRSYEEFGADRALSGITFANSREGYVVGLQGLILFTSNAGESWTQQPTPTSVRLSIIHFINDSVGFAGGKDGVILRTTNKGKSWVQILPRLVPIEVRLQHMEDAVHFIYTLDNADRIAFSIYTPDGRLLQQTSEPGQLPIGEHRTSFDTRGLSSGAYVYKLQGEKHSASGIFTITR